MPRQRRVSEHHINTRLRCLHWLIKAGNMPLARKLAARGPERFASSNGPWLTSVGILMELETAMRKDGFYWRHPPDCVMPVIEVSKGDLGCPHCFAHNLDRKKLVKVQLGKEEK